MEKLAISAEAVEKVQRADSTNFDIVKNQQLTGHRKSQNGRICGFSTGSLYLFHFLPIKNGFDIHIIYGIGMHHFYP